MNDALSRDETRQGFRGPILKDIVCQFEIHTIDSRMLLKSFRLKKKKKKKMGAQ